MGKKKKRQELKSSNGWHAYTSHCMTPKAHVLRERMRGKERHREKGHIVLYDLISESYITVLLPHSNLIEASHKKDTRGRKIMDLTS